MKKFCVIIICFLFVFTLSACSKKDNLTELGKNLTTYNIDLSLDVDKKTASATQTINYINNTNQILKTLKLHLYPQYFEEGATSNVVPSTKLNNAYPNGMSYAEFDVTRLKVNEIEKAILYECDYDSILSVELDNSLLPNHTVNIYIEYDFNLPNCEHRFGYGENTINIANFYPIMCVYEDGKFNTTGYNSNGDPFYSDMSNYCVNISLDKQYIVASSGTKIDESITEGQKIVTISANMIRDFAFVVSDKFDVLTSNYKDTTIEYFHFNDPHAEQSLKAGTDAIKTFSKLFGEYPYSSFSIVETDFLYGGMEYPNLVMISTVIENIDDYLNVIIHETAHQWWYGIVGNDQFNHPWLDEALTEYSTILFYDNNEGYNLTHKQMIDINKSNYTLFVSVYQDVLGAIDTSMRAVNLYSTEPEYTYCTYVKGTLMYESLYQLIGKDKFYKSLKTYYNNNKYTNSTPEKLILAFEQSCKQNLHNFFDSWIAGKVVIR